MKPQEYLLHFQDTTATIDVSPFYDRLPDDVKLVKLRLNTFSFSINNTGTDDSIKVSLSTNIYSPYLLGSTVPTNNLYTTTLYMASGTYATANQTGTMNEYIIIHKDDLRQPLKLTWTITPYTSGVGSIKQAYAMLSLIPM